MAAPVRGYYFSYRRSCIGDIGVEGLKLFYFLGSGVKPQNYPDRAELLANLAYSLSARYIKIENIEDLQAAIKNAELAVLTTSENHSDRAKRLIILEKKYRRLARGHLKSGAGGFYHP